MIADAFATMAYERPDAPDAPSAHVYGDEWRDTVAAGISAVGETLNPKTLNPVSRLE